MIEVLKLLFDGGLIFAICYITTVVGKCIVANMITRNKNMSDEKAKSITKMMSKDINVNFVNKF